MAEHPAETLRRAANLLREAGSTATPPPWRVSYLDGVDPAVDGPAPDGHMVAEMSRCGDPAHEGRQKADATLIVLLGNAREPLAGWLEETAWRAEVIDASAGPFAYCGLCCRDLAPGGCDCWDRALSTAREILGEAEG